MNDPQRVAVVGATGYAGFELAQLLLGRRFALFPHVCGLALLVQAPERP
jgi:N-acetyl-gamma-glutamylphosphate reductase